MNIIFLKKTNFIHLFFDYKYAFNFRECKGRRFVDIEYLFEAIKQIEHKPFGCTFKDLTLKKEIKNGFLSEFVFQCNICNKMEYISNENRNSMSMSINSAIVSATLCTARYDFGHFKHA